MRTILFIAFCILCLQSGPSRASLIELLSTKELTHKSKSIVLGKVSSQWSSFDPEKRMVYTYVKLLVDQTIKGQQQKEILLRIPGGRTKTVAVMVHGMVHFEKGEKTLVFLDHDQDGAPTVLSMSLGKYRIQTDPQTQEEMAHFQAPNNAEYVSLRKSPNLTMLSGQQASHSYKLSHLIGEIREAMKEEK